METYLNEEVLKCEVAIFGVRGVIHNNGLFNEIFNNKGIPMELNKVYETNIDIKVKVSLDEFSTFTEIIWRNKTILNFRGYPNSTQLFKIEDLEFNAGETGYSTPFKNTKLYTSKSISFRYFLDKKNIQYDWNANDEKNWNK